MLRVTGHEIIGDVNVDVADGSLQLSGVWDLNPACWTNSRLSNIAKTYERYRYDSFRLTYLPRAAATTSGLVALSCEFDYDDPLPYGDLGLVTTAQNTVFTQAAIRSPCTTSWRRNQEDKQWYAASFGNEMADYSNACQGRAYAIASSNVAGVNGSVIIEYDITFYLPEMEPRDAGTQAAYGAQTSSATAQNAYFAMDAGAWNVGSSARLAEVVLDKINVNGTLVDSYAAQEGTTGSSTPITLRRGGKLFTAYNRPAGKWQVFTNLVNALALLNPVSNATATSTTLILKEFGRVLDKTGSI